jgi:ribonucleoside-diphosphate reductase alpha chain
MATAVNGGTVVQGSSGNGAVAMAVASHGHGAAAGVAVGIARNSAVGAVGVDAAFAEALDDRFERIREARLKGYEGDACGECGNFTLVRNGTCMKCTTCGATSGCS